MCFQRYSGRLFYPPGEALGMASCQTRTSNMIHSARHASWKARNASGKHPRNVPSERANLTPPPRRLMSQVGRRVAQHARLQSRSNRSNAAGTGLTQLHFCRQASPDAEVPPLPASLARRRSLPPLPASLARRRGYWCSAPADQASSAGNHAQCSSGSKFVLARRLMRARGPGYSRRRRCC